MSELENLETDSAFESRQKQTTWFLSIAGAIPFLTLALALHYFGKANGFFEPFTDAFKIYAAVILSFLGGIRWGLSLAGQARSSATLILSVLPSIAAWLLVIAPDAIAIVGLLLAFCAHGAWDSFSLGKTLAPAWFTRLRMTITFIVALAHIIALIAVF